jgi:hypothetical protein
MEGSSRLPLTAASSHLFFSEKSASRLLHPLFSRFHQPAKTRFYQGTPGTTLSLPVFTFLRKEVNSVRIFQLAAGRVNRYL